MSEEGEHVTKILLNKFSIVIAREIYKIKNKNYSDFYTIYT
jgi:hypothetical protein